MWGRGVLEEQKRLIELHRHVGLLQSALWTFCNVTPANEAEREHMVKAGLRILKETGHD
jgi:hypothetical protein